MHEPAKLEFLIEQAKVACLPDRLYSVLHAQFGEDMADMAFDGIDGNHQFLGNLLVGCTMCQQLQNLQFSLTQGLWQWLGFGGLSQLLYMRLALLRKGGKQCVEIGGWSMFALLVSAAERAELPLGLLRPQSCGYSPLARPDGLPLRGRREPASPAGASGGPGLARAGSQSHVPSAGLWLLSASTGSSRCRARAGCFLAKRIRTHATSSRS